MGFIQWFPYGSSRLPILFAYHCGLRLGEACGVFWQDIDFEAQTLYVCQQIQYADGKLVFVPPKYNSDRTIRLDSYVLAVLKKTKSEQQNRGEYYTAFYVQSYQNARHRLVTGKEPSCDEISPVYVGEDGSLIGLRTGMHTRRVIHYQLGYPEYSFHSLHHAHTIMLAEWGALPKDIQNRLRHKDIAVTMQIYVHLAQKMENVSTGIWENVPIPGRL